MPRQTSRAVADAAFAVGNAAADSAVPLAARVPILAERLVSPSLDGVAGWRQAWSEKALSAWEGTLAVCGGWNDLVWRSILSPFTPAGIAEEAFVLVRAVSEPGHNRVRANALRLGRR